MYVPTFVIVVEVVTADTLEYVSRMTIASEKVARKEKNLHFYCKVTGNDDCDVVLAPSPLHKQYSFVRALGMMGKDISLIVSPLLPTVVSWSTVF